MTIQVHVHVGGSDSICIQPLYGAGFTGVNEEKFSKVDLPSTLSKTQRMQ